MVRGLYLDFYRALVRASFERGELAMLMDAEFCEDYYDYLLSYGYGLLYSEKRASVR